MLRPYLFQDGFFMFGIARQIIKWAPSLASFLGIPGRILRVGASEIWCETFGIKKNPCILLIMGGGCQGICWGESFCEKLASQGFFVVRFDNRDTGFSTSYSKKCPYNLMDMAKETVELLKVLGISKAHICGISMGGAIAQLIAFSFPSYVSTIILMATTSDFAPLAKAFSGTSSSNSNLSGPSRPWLQWLQEMEAIPLFHIGSQLKKHLEGWEILNGSKTPFEKTYYKAMMRRTLLRQRSWRSLLHHKNALISSVQAVKETEGKIIFPTLIIAGCQDPLFSEDHAENLAANIRGSCLYKIEEMGHNFNPCFFEQVAQKITGFIQLHCEEV